MFGLIGSALGAIGSLFGGRKKQEQVVNRVDYKRMVRDAEAAGFNPLTALRNGGAAGFSVTSQPVLSSSGQALGEAFGQIGNFITNFDPFEDKMREVQYNTMLAQLDNIQADTRLKSRDFLFQPPAVSGRRKMTSGPLLGQKALPASAGASVTPEVETPTVTNPLPTESGLHVNPGWPDASAAEERWGEWGGSLYGLGVAVVDAYYNMQRVNQKTRSEWNARAKLYTDWADKKAVSRERRLKKEAAENARSLGFSGY